MEGFNISGVSDVYVGDTLAKQIYIHNKKVWDYKKEPIYTAPTAKTGLEYTGSAQALLNAGSTSHGTIQYSSDGFTWSTTIPTSTNASTNITVYWRLVGDNRHTDIPSTAIVCLISKALPTYTAPTAKNNLVYNGNDQALLNAGSTNHGTILYSSNNSTWNTTIPTGNNATSYTVYWRLVGDANHNGVSSKSISCSISLVTPTVTAPTAKSLTYSGSAQSLVNAGSTNWGTLQYSLDNSTWSTSIPTGTNATSYTVYYKVVGNSNINNVAAKSVACSILKVTPTVTAPTAKVLTYNTLAQQLVNAGSTNFGTLNYSLNNSTWSTDIPTATNYGSYTVYYKVVGNSNINDVSSASVACSISEKKVTATVTLSQSTYTYSGNACTPTVTVKDGTVVIPASEYTVSYSNNTNAGTATVTITDNTGGNYDVIGSATFTINKATGIAGVSNRSLSYSRSALNLVTVSGNTGTVHYRIGSSGSFSTSIPTATNAGIYTIQYYVDASTNYNGVASSSSPNSVSTTIAQVTPVLSTSPSLATGLTYNGSAKNLLTGGAMKHSSSDTTSVAGTFTYTQQTNAGTYNNPTWSFTPTDTTNYKSASGTITGNVTIAKATGTATVSPISVSYNGSARNLVSVSGNTGTMHYRLGTGGSWTTTIPTATNAASYDIYWYMDASANYNGLHSSSSPAKVTSSIAKIDPTITAPTAKTGLVYNSSEQTLWNAGTNTTAGSFSYSKGTNAGSYNATWTFIPTDTTNYNTKSGSATISIAKAAGSISYATTSVSKTYGNAAFTNSLTKTGDGTVTYSSSNTSVATVNSSGQVTINAAGSATITATVADGTNYTYATTTASYTLSVAKATPTVTAPTAKSLTYSGAAQTLVNAGSTTGGTLQYKLGSGSYGTGLPSATVKGDYTVYYKVVGNGNYNDVAEKSISVSIAAKALTITAKAQTINYGDSIATGTSQVTTSGLASGDSLTAITLTASTSNVPGGTITPSAGATTNGIGNYSVTYSTGVLTINKVNPTYTAPAATNPTYNGSAQYLITMGSTSHGTIKYSSDGNTWSTTRPTGTNVTSYNVYWKLDGDSNHNSIGSTKVTSSIGKVTPTVTAPTAKVLTYNTSAQALVNAGSTNFGTLKYSLNNSTWSTSVPTATNQGSYTVYYKVDGDSNVNSVAANSVACSINEKKITATVTLSQSSYTYSGSACTPTVTVKDGTTVIPASEYTVTYSNNTNVGTATVTITDKTGGNYEVVGSATFTISKAAPTYTAPTKTTPTYNKTAQALLYAGSTSHGTIYYSSNNSTWNTTIPTGTNASSYDVYWKLTGDSNHSDVASTKITVTIAQREVTLTWGTLTWTYDKSAHSTTCTAGNVVSGDTCSVTLTGNSITNKGTTTVTASSLSNSNYKLPSSKTNTLTINARTVTLSWGTLTWIYDGSAHSTTCTAGNLCSGDTCTVTLTGNSITNKGTATVTASSISNSNYTLPSTKTATLTINAKEVGLSWGTTSWTYDKASHSTTCTATGLVGSDTCTVTLTGNSVGANVGSATVTASSLSNSNYKLPSANTKTISITAKTVSLSWGTLSWTYDAAAHSTTCTAGSLISGDTCTVTLTGNSITNKGTTTVTASSLSNSNYTLPSSKTNTLTINARPINVTAASASKTYNGSALTSNSATAESTGTNRGLVSGHSMTSCTVTGTITNAGSTNNVPSAAVIKSGSTDVTSNYSITYVNGTLTVNKANRTLSFANSYDVVAPSGSITKTATASAGSSDGTISYSSSNTNYATVASDGKVTAKTTETSVTISATITGGNNYNDASASYILYIFATTHNFAYTGSVLSLTLPPGSYQLLCWGAQGGTCSAGYSGGKGGYSTGVLTVSENKTVYIFVGGQGSASGNGGWNGGGGSTGSSSGTDSDGNYAYSSMGCGGGATDIALVTSSMDYVVGNKVYDVIDADEYIKNQSANHYLTPYIPVRAGTTYNAEYTIGKSGAVPIFQWFTSDHGYIKDTASGVAAPSNAAYLRVMIWDDAYQQGAPTYSAKVSVYHSSGTPSYGRNTRSVASLRSRIIVAGGGGGGTYYKREYQTTSDVNVYDASGLTSSYQISGATHYFTDHISILPNTTYYATGSINKYGNAPTFQWEDENKHNISWEGGWTLTSPSNAKYMRLLLWDDSYSNVELGYSYNLSVYHKESQTVTEHETDYCYGGVGGGTSAGGTYGGGQGYSDNSPWFGLGAVQSSSSCCYCSGASGAGWYGGGGPVTTNTSSSRSTAICGSGGGSGFVNTSANANYRPSGYTGLLLDSGTTYAGNTSFPSTSSGNETGHAGNGYTRITRL